MGRKTFLGCLIVGLIGTSAPQAVAQSAPDRGRAFEPKVISRALYGVRPPQSDPTKQTAYVQGAGGTPIYVEAWLPAPSGANVPPRKVPTILVITPYTGFGSIEEPDLMKYAVPRGYAYVQMHVRGTGNSGGCQEQFSSNEVVDAANVIEWIATESSWSNGVIGGSGLSYPGISLAAVAGRGDPEKVKYLKAIIAGGIASAQYDYNFFDGVPFTGAAAFHSAIYNGVVSPLPPDALASWPYYPQKATCVLDIMLGSADMSGDMTPFWQDRDHRRGAANIKAASLIYHGHYDGIDTPIALAGFFDQLPRSTPKAAVIGAWGHASPDRNRDHQAWSRADWLDMQLAWFDHHLKGLRSGADGWPTVQVQGMDGQWRVEHEWPTTGGPVGQLALGSEGRLGETRPRGSTAYSETLGEGMPSAGRAEATFVTPRLPGRLQLTGLPVLDLWVELDAPDAHIAARLEALDPSGRPIPYGITYGYRSARHLVPIRNQHFVQTEGRDASVGKPIRIPLRFDPIDIIVPRGGRLRLTVSGAQGRYPGALPLEPASSSQPSGSFTTVNLLHNCRHPSTLRFLTPRTRPQLLNVREVDEIGRELPSTPSGSLEVHGGGLATSELCGRAPTRIDLLQP